MRLAAQPGPADDAAERDQQLDVLLADRGEHRAQAVDLRREGAAQLLLGQGGERVRLVAAGAVQHGGDRAERRPEPLDRAPDLLGRGHVGPLVAHLDAGGRHPGEVGRHLRVRGRVGPAEQGEPGAGVLRHRERALGGDALPAAGHEQHVGGVQRRALGRRAVRPEVGQGVEDRHGPGALGGVADLGEPGRGGDVADHAGDRGLDVAGARGRHVGQADHGGGDLRVLEVQRPGQARGAEVLLDDHEAGLAGGGDGRLRGGQEQLQVLLAVGRQAQQHAVAERGLHERGPQPLGQRVAGGRVQRPGTRRAQADPDARGPGAGGHVVHRERAHPRRVAGDLLRPGGPVLRGVLELVDQLGELAEGDRGEVRRRGQRGAAELADGVVDDLADGDRAQVQVVERVGLRGDRLDRQLDAVGGEPAQQVERRGARGRAGLPGRLRGRYRLGGRREVRADLRRGLARARQELRLGVLGDRPHHAVGEQRGRVDGGAERVGRRGGGQERGQRGARGVQGQHQRGRCGLADQSGQRPARADLEHQVRAVDRPRRGLLEAHRLARSGRPAARAGRCRWSAARR